MSALQIGSLLIYALGMSLGQLLFKLAALSIASNGALVPIGGKLLQLVLNPYFIGALIMYLGLSVLWVWLLTFIPLSRAYPFVVTAFIFTPLLGDFFFDETVGVKFYLGVVFIVVGLIFIIKG